MATRGRGIAAASGILVVGAVAGAVAWMARPSLPVEPIGGDFTLTDHEGRPFELASLRGKPVLIFFGYSSCPDVCPVTLSKLSIVSRELGDAADDLRVLYITVDPERDTPEVLKEELGNFDLQAIGLTGTREEIDPVVRQYGAYYEIVPTPESAGRYTVMHTSTLYALDRKGRVRLLFPYQATVDEIAEGVEQLLRTRG